MITPGRPDALAADHPARAGVPEGFRRAFVINLASVAGGHVSAFVVSLLLARLLVPADLGVVAIALAIMGIAQVLRDFGVGAYLQRVPALDPPVFGACLGLLCATTALLGLLLLAMAGPLSHRFGQPALRPLLEVMLVGFAISPFSLVMSALMQRDLDAARIAWVSRIGGLAHATTAVGLAALGFGAMSLAWAYVVNVVACSVAYGHWRPADLAWRPSLRGWRPLLRFGCGAVAVGGLASVNNALPELLLGRLASAQQVGYLGRANAVVNLFQAVTGTAVNFGALRRLSEHHQRETGFGIALERATALLTGAAWPVLALTALFATPVVTLLYGPAWIPSAAAVPALAAAVALGLLFNFSDLALTAVGRPHLATAPVMVTLAARAGLAALFFDGSLVRFAWILLGAALAALPVQAMLLVRVLGQDAGSLLRIAARSAAPCGAAVAAAACLRDAPLAALAVALPAWLLSLRAVGHPLWLELAQVPRLRSTIRK